VTGWFRYSPDNATTDYAAERWLRNVHRRGFRTVRLNAVGWIALVAPGVVLGLLFARLTSRSLVLWGLVGGAVIVAAAMALDHFRAGRRQSGLSVELLNETELERLAEAGRHAGIRFEHEVDSADEDGPRSKLSTQYRHLVRLHRLVEEVRDPT